MILESKGHVFHACMKKMTLESVKYEKGCVLGFVAKLLLIA